MTDARKPGPKKAFMNNRNMDFLLALFLNASAPAGVTFSPG